MLTIWIQNQINGILIIKVKINKTGPEWFKIKLKNKYLYKSKTFEYVFAVCTDRKTKFHKPFGEGIKQAYRIKTFRSCNKPLAREH